MPIRSRFATQRANPRAGGRKALIAVAALLPVGLGLVTATSATAQQAVHPAPSVISNAISNGISNAAAGTYSVAPYVDMGESTESLLDTAITSKGLKSYTAAFVIGEGCTDIWGDTEPVGNDPYIDPEIAKAKSEGASVIISSGGADGYSIPWTCTDQSTIDSALQAIVTDYGTNVLDFDIEGGAIADTASATRLFTAMKTLKASNSGLQFSVTMPVLPSGLTGDGVNILKAAQAVGVKIDIVNIMAMDYYQGDQDMGQAAISAAQATLAQMQSVDSSYTYANLGITPMIGVNDDGSTFTLANANTVESWAASNGVGRLAFWSLTRDESCSTSDVAKPASPASSPSCSGVSQNPLDFTSAFVPF
ncbi:MAG TPA: chitinase [Pseudonocardiaceae bacterium]|jgi:chitinase|nr:chitinase [Pseudonocardiaceae bacterium]